MTNIAMPTASAAHRLPSIRLNHERWCERASDKIKPATAITGAANQIIMETVAFIGMCETV